MSSLTLLLGPILVLFSFSARANLKSELRCSNASDQSLSTSVQISMSLDRLSPDSAQIVFNGSGGTSNFSRIYPDHVQAKGQLQRANWKFKVFRQTEERIESDDPEIQVQGEFIRFNEMGRPIESIDLICHIPKKFGCSKHFASKAEDIRPILPLMSVQI